jgi:hypothetical protein
MDICSRRWLISAFSVLAVATTASADSLLVGFNTQTPLQVYTTGGTFQEDFGSNGASAGIEENGLLYVVTPNASNGTSSVVALNGAQQTVGSFTVHDLIADGAPGPTGALWLSGYNGTVYEVSTGTSTLGNVLSSFSTGFTNATSVGVASNGSTLYTSEGDSGDGIDVRNSSGAVQSTIHTGYKSLYGLAYDSANSSIWAGTFSFLYDFSLNGTLLATLNESGNSAGALHDGLELGNLSLLQSPPPPPPPPPPSTVPEPGFGWLTGVLLVPMLFVNRNMRSAVKRAVKLAPAFLLGGNVFGSVLVTLNPDAVSRPVGDTINFTASASDTSNPSAALTYQFGVRPTGSGAFSIVKNFYSSNTLAWTATDPDGSYDVQVTVHSSTGSSNSATTTVQYTSRVTGSTPVVSGTANPLVALYSAPPCTSSKFRVRFRAENANAWQATPYRACNSSNQSVNVYLAGMLPSTKYVVQQDVFNGPFDSPGPQLPFTTGALPRSFATATNSAGPTAPTSISYPFIIEARGYYPWAHDLNGNVVWYSAAMNNPSDGGSYLRPTSSGTFLAFMDDPNVKCPTTGSGYCANHMFLREFDLAGNLVRETNWIAINAQIAALRSAHGLSPANLIWISHEGTRLPNGYTATFLTDERVANQGNGPVDVAGDDVVVLDQNFQAVWEWDAFDRLDITRKAILNDTCSTSSAICPPARNKTQNGQYYTSINDWTHMNSVTLDPTDNNLIVSSRAQSWVWKVNYANGAGDGHIIWTLGKQGSFSLPGGTPQSAWFSYQHDAQVWPDSQCSSGYCMMLFDNNNVQVTQNGGGDSRGQVWNLDLSSMTATPVLNVDLGFYSSAVGYASVLSNGNYDFSSGCINSCAGPQTETQTVETTPGQTVVYREQLSGVSYRSIRVPDLYTER